MDECRLSAPSLSSNPNVRDHYLSPSRVAVLDPAQVDCTEAVPRDACESMVVVLVDVGVEGGIQVDVVPLPASPQPIFHGLVSQPLLQFGGSDHIVDDTLRHQEGAMQLDEIEMTLYTILKCYINS